jgi:predicted lysophospholipase L1 biosynthesis ABC-type transport system permease subunit
VLDLRLRNPATAQAFANQYGFTAVATEVVPWTGIADADALLVQDEQDVLSPGAWLAALLAIASVAVLVGGRMTERTRRVGLLKAVGASPGLVTATLMAENLVLALAAAGAGLVAGWLAAPLLTSPGAALVGTPGAPSLTVPIAGLVLAVALAVALAATLGPAIRAARGSTVSALADAPRPPRRRPRLLAMSRGLPVPLLLGLRLVARRPRRAVLGAANVAVTMAGVVAVLTFHATAGQKINGGGSGLSDPVYNRDEQVLLVLTIILLMLAALNAVVTAWTTMLDTRHPAALARALGATPRNVTAGLTAAQLLPAVPGTLFGIPLSIGLFAAADHGGLITLPPAWWPRCWRRWPTSPGSRPYRRASAPAARRPRSCKPRRPDERGWLLRPVSASGPGSGRCRCCGTCPRGRSAGRGQGNRVGGRSLRGGRPPGW